jgi:dTDP-4-amino-4,6-dideoxygalactose transaminase
MLSGFEGEIIGVIHLGTYEQHEKRSQEMLNGLEKAVSDLPNGVINERKKRYKDKVYSYYYLKYREGEKVFNRHIVKKELQTY